MIAYNDLGVQQFLDENSRVLIMFGAKWCGPCKAFKPKFLTISLENPDIEEASVVGPSVDRIKELVEKIRNRANP